jgi:phosphomannomutase
MSLAPHTRLLRLLQDKDGISAAVAFTQLAAHLASKGSSVSAHLASLQQRYGVFVGRQSYFTAQQPSQSAAVFEAMRAGGNYPKVTSLPK